MSRRKINYSWLRRRVARVRVHSCADGSFGIEAQWNEPFVWKREGRQDDWTAPGLFTRMATAEEIEAILNRFLGAT